MSTNEEITARLARSRVLVVGIGGLGAPAASTLAAAGIGMLRLVDPDRIEVSNLHRQPLYEIADLGLLKVQVAADRLRLRHPALRVDARPERFGVGHLCGVDVVLDGTDTIAAKFAVNDACVTAGVPLVHAGVLGFRAQLLTVLPGRSACYRCLFEEPPPPGDAPSCEQAGVLGPVPVLVGALQAAETIRLLAGAGPAFADRLLTIDTRAGRWRSVPIGMNPCCPVCSTFHVTGRSEAR
jgi:molybdopterin-synthase adenylyltransferase